MFKLILTIFLLINSILAYPQRSEFRKQMTCTIDPTSGQLIRTDEATQTQNVQFQPSPEPPRGGNGGQGPLGFLSSTLIQPIEKFGQNVGNFFGQMGQHRDRTTIKPMTSTIIYIPPPVQPSPTTEKEPSKNLPEFKIDPNLDKQQVCPQGKDYRKSRVDEACYQLKNNTACPNQFMTFYLDRKDPDNYGYCDCAETVEKYNYRPILAHVQEKKCYPAYDKGPCQTGEWFVPKDKTFKGQCKPNTCESKSLSPETESLSIFRIPLNGECYTHKTRGVCEAGRIIYYANPGDIDPSCVIEEVLKDEIMKKEQDEKENQKDKIGVKEFSGVPDIGCPSGQKKTGDNRCSGLPSF